MTTTLDAFAQALRHSDEPLPAGLRAWNGSDPGVRFNVYRNNIAVSLVDALCVAYPVCLQLVGDEFFRAMARIYVDALKPSSRLMWRYGGDFCDFVEVFEPASSVPYLADVARLEAARVVAFHAADSVAIDLHTFAAIDPERLSDVRVVLHPAHRIIRSQFAIFSLWAAHQGAITIDSVDPFKPEDALVTRPEFEVEVSLVPPGAVEFLDSLSRGQTLGEATICGQSASLQFDLAQTLRTIVDAGACHSIRYNEGEEK